jgi:predicted dehydrogenase
MNNFVDHVLYDKPTLAPGRDGLAVQRMLDALYRSAAEAGAEVRI